MKKTTKWGLILQIPNAILLILALIYLVISNINFSGVYFNLNTLSWIVFGTLYSLMNIASLVLLLSGINNEN